MKGLWIFLVLAVSNAWGATLSEFYGFTGSTGYAPGAPVLQASDGNFYVANSSGGSNCSGGACAGTVVKVTPAGQATVLRTFVCSAGSATQGACDSESALLEGSDGFLYGTAVTSSSGGGIAFKISKTGQFQK